MKVLVTGKNGQLAQCIAKIHPNWTFVDRTQFDISNKMMMMEYLKDKEFDFCINTAAFTKVDDAEDIGKVENELINSESLIYLSQVLNTKNIFLIHISTDYVYGDVIEGVITENSTADPINNYGKAKLKGEHNILDNSNKSIIIRTSWLYSDISKNFNNTMIALTSSKPDLKVIHDQLGTPTNCYDLAKDLLKICNHILNNKSFEREFDRRVYNYTNLGVTTWYDFASLIKTIHSPLHKCYIRPCQTSEFETKANRQKNSILSKDKIIEEFGLEIPNWIDSYIGLYR
jgi:dTDP-4-dehydrorhamnose reductase